MSLNKSPQHFARNDQDGYVLLTLLLAVAMMIIFAASVMPSITAEIKRDREEEMIHRGVQYTRAIRLYYRKLGRYPTKLEDLESTNNMRFLRRRYKDPVSGKDFELLHLGEARLSMAGAGVPGVNAVGSAGVVNANGSPAAMSNVGGLGTASGLGPNSELGQNCQSADQDASSGSSQLPGPDTESNNADSGSTDANPPGIPSQIIGGSIVGVVSTSKAVGIREFDHKRKYSEWQFVFDPTAWMGLPTAPNQRPLQLASAPPLNPDSALGTSGRAPSNGPQNASDPPFGGGTSTSNQSGNQSSPSSNQY
jgi:type II secretory pathway pseudopilin PulG